MQASVDPKGRVLLQDGEGKIVGNLGPKDAIKLGLDLLDAGKKAAEQAGMTDGD